MTFPTYLTAAKTQTEESTMEVSNSPVQVNQTQEEVMEPSNVAVAETTTQESNMETTIAAVQNNQSQEDVMESSNVAVTENNLLAELKRVYEIAINSPDFVTAHRSKALSAIKALTLSDPETRVIAQLTAHAEKKLFADAGLAVVKNGGVFVAPTKEEIDAHVAVGLAAWKKKQK